MKSIQEVFDEIQELKQKQKEIRTEYRDALASDEEYTNINDQQKELREKKKQIETMTQQQMGSRYEELEQTSDELKELDQMISDIAITNIMNGESILVKDKYDNDYEPKYKVTLKKSN